MNTRISALVLAAGLSRRAAPHNKLLLPARGPGSVAVVRSTVEAVVASGFGEVIVVTGHQRELVEAALGGLPVRFVHAIDFASGMGNSLAAGVRAAAPDAVGFAVIPGDLPFLEPALIRKVVERFREHGAARHIVPLAAGQRGHPVILGAWLRPQLENLTGDIGARALLAKPEEKARCGFFEVSDPAILRDVDRGWTSEVGRSVT